MIVARWTFDARFGHKNEVLELTREWWTRIAPQIGWSADQARFLTGSIGAPESCVVVEVALDDLGALHDAWKRLGDAEGQIDWARRLAPHIVDGTPGWEVLRIVA